MLKKIQSTLYDVDAQITFIKNENLNIVDFAIQSLKIYEKASVLFFNFENEVTFQNNKWEVEYFKNIKSVFLSNLFYFHKIIEIENSKLYSEGCGEIFHTELKKITYFERMNVDFFNYYNSNDTFNDKMFFSYQRCSTNIFGYEIFFEGHGSNNQKYDIIRAHFIANDKIKVYLVNELSSTYYDKIKSLKLNLKWTRPKIELSELVYCLHGVKCINNGEISIAELSRSLSIFFDIELGNVYHSLNDIKNRADSKTIFLDKMKKKFNEKIEENSFEYI